jgi:hypothetical protein
MSARTIAAAAERATQKANASPALFFDFRGAGYAVSLFPFP